MNPVIDSNGAKNWFNIKGQHHRTDGPAIECSDGYKAWYQNGVRHRTDGPAIECSDGYKAWYQNGVRHRTDGPAIESADGSKSWYLNGVRHRTDGPAIVGYHGYELWFLNGLHLPEDLFLKLTKGPVKKLPLYLGLGTGIDLFISERIKQHESVVQYRTDGPACEWADGSKEWWLNGVRHRTDGPACEWADIEYASGYKEWCLNGTQLSEDLFLKLTKGPVKKLPLYMNMGFDQFISERLKT